LIARQHSAMMRTLKAAAELNPAASPVKTAAK
jgi:hypothetical protein